MKINSKIHVQYIGEDNPLSLRTGKEYEARILKKGWYGIVDETNEEYAYPPELFEIADELSNSNYRRTNKPTPSGGAYSEIYFFDNDGNAVDEKEASRCVIRECAENGDLINEIWGTV